MANHRVLGLRQLGRSDFGLAPEGVNLPTIISRRPNMLFVAGFGDTVAVTPTGVQRLLSPAQQAAANRAAAAAQHATQTAQARAAAAVAAAEKKALAAQVAAQKKAAAAELAAQKKAAAKAAADARKSQAVIAAQARKDAAALAHAAALAKAAAAKQAAQLRAAQAVINRTHSTITAAQATAARATVTMNTATTATQQRAAQAVLAHANNTITAATEQQDQAAQVLAAAGVQPNAAVIVTQQQTPTISPQPIMVTAHAGLPTDINNIGTLPLGLPGQQPAENISAQLTSAANAGNIPGITQPQPIFMAGATSNNPLSSNSGMSNFAGGQPFADPIGSPFPATSPQPPGATAPSPLLLIGAAALLILLLKK